MWSTAFFLSDFLLTFCFSRFIERISQLPKLTGQALKIECAISEIEIWTQFSVNWINERRFRCNGRNETVISPFSTVLVVVLQNSTIISWFFFPRCCSPRHVLQYSWFCIRLRWIIKYLYAVLCFVIHIAWRLVWTMVGWEMPRITASDAKHRLKKIYRFGFGGFDVGRTIETNPTLCGLLQCAKCDAGEKLLWKCFSSREDSNGIWLEQNQLELTIAVRIYTY